MTVECTEPGDTYLVEPDAFGDACMKYYADFFSTNRRPAMTTDHLYYVLCPQCGQRINVRDADVESQDLVAICPHCPLVFQYAESELHHTAHDLIPADDAQHIPPLYATEHDQDPIVHLKWFTPDSLWTSYVTEYDPTNACASASFTATKKSWAISRSTRSSRCVAHWACGLNVTCTLSRVPCRSVSERTSGFNHER
jgi:hypothetical protein